MSECKQRDCCYLLNNALSNMTSLSQTVRFTYCCGNYANCPWYANCTNSFAIRRRNRALSPVVEEDFVAEAMMNAAMN